jgi:hypothetical protein
VKTVASERQRPVNRTWQRRLFGHHRIALFPIALVATMAVAALLRLIALDRLPPGLHFDEAANLFDILDIKSGERSIFFTRNNGREPLFIYWQAIVADWLGPTAYALRVASAIVGVATIASGAYLARHFFALVGERRANAGALLTALTLTFTYWHVHFSRLGLRTISFPLLLALAGGTLFMAIRSRSTWHFLLAGALAGLSLYTYHSARLVPLLVAPLLLGYVVRERSRRAALQVVGFGLAFTVVFAPLGSYYVTNRDDFLKHSADISVFNPEINGGDLPAALRSGVVRTAAMFVWRGTPSGAENLPNRPLLDPGFGALFVLGLLLVAVRFWPRLSTALASATARGEPDDPVRTSRPVTGSTAEVYGFLFWWLFVMSLPPILSVNPPSYVRSSGLIPVVALVVAIGGLALLGWASRLFAGRRDSISRALVVAPTVILIGLGAVATTRDYFGVWGPGDIAFGWMMDDKVQAAEKVMDWSASDRVFLAPLYAQDLTVRYVARDTVIETFDVGSSLVVPVATEQAVRYAFPIDDHEQPAIIAAQFPSGLAEEIVYDRSGRWPILRVLTASTDDLPPPPEEFLATFGPSIVLARVQRPESGLRRGEQLPVELIWFTRERPTGDYTIFLHLRDPSEKTLAQVDSMPGRGSIPTSRWRAGDYIHDRYQLHVPADAPAGEYKIAIGMYARDWQDRLPIAGASGQALGTELDLGRITVLAR